jgi:crotonobetainyl-CoA:carnitine CoA-transferase CaiB-like acyl-CoA transferase
VSAALSGLRVLDLSAGVAGPMAAMLLGDFGADVLKVERPAGDPARERPGFAMWNRNKRGIAVDPATQAGQAELRHLLRCADVCVGSDGRGAVSAFTDATAAAEANPALVYLQMPAFLGPPRWAGGHESAGLLMALTGLSLRQSSTDGGPVEPVFGYPLYLQAISGATAAVAALVDRHRTGRGQIVTVGGVHAAMVAAASAFVFDPEVPEVPASFGPAGPNPMYSWYRCADGAHVFLATLTPKFENAAIGVLGLAEVLADERIRGDFVAMLLPENRGWVRARFEAAFEQRTSEEWLRLLREADVPAGRVLDREQWWQLPLLDSLAMRAQVLDPERGQVTMPANPVNLDRTPASIGRPAPRLGEHAGQAAWGPAVPAGQALTAGPPPGGYGPLAGFRVLDLGAILAGPFAGTLLAELGADVIKVEVPAGDSWRQRGMPFIRGQRGLAIDLRSERGRAVFADLVESADVVLDNYRVGVLERLGISYAALAKIKPDVIAMSITGYGYDPGYSAEPAFDGLMQARSGMLAAQGGPAGPVLASVPINDVTSAALAAFGIVIALHHRQRTGEGQSGWVALAATAALAQCEDLVNFPGRTPPPRGATDYRGEGALDCCYATSDGWVRIEVAKGDGTDTLRRAGLLTGPEPASEDELRARLAAAFAMLRRDDAVRLLTDFGIPAVPVRLLAETVDDPDYLRWETFNATDRGPRPPLLLPGRHAWFSRTQHHRVLRAPGVGEHTAEILAEAGYDAGTISELAAAGVVRLGVAMDYRPLPAYR